ncbi:hypothetical protein N7492_005359 [Penicillium capsulatum]|uniref:Zn(2)-C6 fungal-type domain-containing protein n=1 Tax=Penicillium capsulatum TaxID=69766 RepID=A0A9W9LRK7_9EURO|nr:hypothetical protein N7492_005359 [Penicillium capsulatum]KAJ6135541.1 hypothetical protein N7512_000701 [Penicillium capsulatum]
MARAARSCHVCKTRKKGCDKALPQCGSCIQRGLPCSYYQPDCPHKDERPSTEISLSDRVPNLISGYSDVNIPATLHFHLGKLLRVTNLSVPRIGERYFRDLHRGLPILCPTLFRESVAEYKGKTAPVDFSVLLLALCLLAWNPSSDIRSRPRLIHRDNLYTTVRVLFLRVRAAIRASKSLAQASILIAAYEYASGQPHLANRSLEVCTGIMSEIEWKLQNPNELKALPKDRSLRLRVREKVNLWWSVATLERIVLCDIPGCNQSLFLQFPCRNTPLPPDLLPAQDHSDLISLKSGPILAATHDNSIGGFGRQIQVTYILDQLLKAIQNPTDTTAHIAHLKGLDQELQRLMAILIRDCDHEWRYYCGAIGTAVRSLFLLHKHIQILPPADPETLWLQKSSQAALDFVTNIMADVAHDHLQRLTVVNAGVLPLSCAYNLRASINHIEWQRSVGRTFSTSSLGSLVALENICFQRWRGDTGVAGPSKASSEV